MVGTAGLPHVIVRFFTVKRVKMPENQQDMH
jgi:Na+(H+)/acetate symporter ActP